MDSKEQAVFVKCQKFTSWYSKKLFYHFKCKYQRNKPIRRGEVYYIDLGENIGSEQNKARPCVVIQADAYNSSAATFICAVISDNGRIIPDIHIPITGTYNYMDDKGVQKQ